MSQKKRSAPATPPIDPARIKALFIAAAGHFAQEQWAEAEALLDQHLLLAPGSWAGLCLKAMLAEQNLRFPVAEKIWQQLLAARPEYLDGHCHLGFICERERRFAEAEQHYLRALQLDPDCLNAFQGLGLAYRRQGEYQKALASLQQALQRLPQHAETYFNLGLCWQAMGEIERALAAYETACELDPEHPSAAGNLLLCQHYSAHLSTQARTARAAQWGSALEARIAPSKDWPNCRQAERTLRIGIVSGDLRAHPVGYFLENFLRYIDRDQMHIIAFFNHAQEDALSARLKANMHSWHAVQNMNDAALIAKIQSEQIDILLDLSGHTAQNRLPVFAAKPAAVQASWLGYFASTGLARIAYILADPYCVPAGEEEFFTEKVWRLPHSRMCFSAPPDAPAVSDLPAMRADAKQFTFGCFQDLNKINDTVLAVWARILQAAPESKLRIQSVRLGLPEVLQRFKARLSQAGIAEQRYRLHGAATRQDYLQAYSEVDIVLDTFPYPGGTTTAEALWMGVPTISLSTPGMLGRQGQSLLSNAGLADWVCHDEETYLALALQWAAPQRWAELAQLRAGLREQLQGSALFDAAQFAQDWQTALRAVWREWCQTQVAAPDAGGT